MGWNFLSGSMLHLEAVIQQFIPVGPVILSLGVEGFYLDQLTGDRGAGAVLGRFEGITVGLGPVLGCILPLSKQSLVMELK